MFRLRGLYSLQPGPLLWEARQESEAVPLVPALELLAELQVYPAPELELPVPWVACSSLSQELALSVSYLMH